MKNSIKLSIPFSFKGEDLSPFALIDLDKYMESGEELPALELVVAQQNNINVHSYEYEVMQMAEFVYSDPKGLAVDFYKANAFDMQGFKDSWEQMRVLEKLQKIAKQVLDIDDFASQEGIKQAMLAAYQLGNKEK